ncbi:CENP-B N-terminal DNA-binding domain [Popillia japonica]|uniref:CENP-B N-terminal DNA-binding domain n=1 Tax=Popillia japonica TaxID=7064 RepID=A0AAW1L8C1_POPJA
MPRTYKRKLGARKYKDYSTENVETALTKIVDEGWSLRRAAAHYKIPFGTLNNKYYSRYTKKNGGQKVFSDNAERSFLNAACICGDWGFPLTITDLRLLAKNYLNEKGRNVGRFIDNVPGVKWAYSLLNRHKDEVSQKVAANIKRARANVSRETVNKYFDHLRETLKDVPVGNVIILNLLYLL